MTKKIQKWGNSHAIRIPNAYVKAFEWKNGSNVDIKRSGNSLIITTSKPKYNLDDMVEDMTKKYDR